MVVRRADGKWRRGSRSSGVFGGLIRVRSPCGMFIESRPVSGVVGTELLWACLLLHLIYGPGSENKGRKPSTRPHRSADMQHHAALG